MSIDKINAMGKPKDDDQIVRINSNLNTVTMSGNYIVSGVGTTYTTTFYDPYKESESKYGKSVVDEYRKLRAMSIDEFAKSEFYKDILKDK